MREATLVALSVDALLAERVAREPDAPVIAMLEWPEVVTVARLHGLAGSAAAFLAARGIRPGDRVVIWGQNSISWLVWLCAAAWRGAAVVALNPTAGEPELAAAVGRTRPKWIVADAVARGRDLGGMAQRAAAAFRSSGLEGVTVVPGADGAPDFEPLLDHATPPPPLLGQPDAPLCLQLTSGSTGQPKAVVLSHRALLLNAARTAAHAGFVATDRLASPMPLCHAAGLSSGFVLALATGALWCTSPRFQAAHLWSLIDRHRCTVLQGVPTMFTGLLGFVEQHGLATPSLRLGFMGGSHCPMELRTRSAERFGLDHVVTVYGQTEFGPTIALTTAADPPAAGLDSVGRVVPGTAVRIVDPASGRDLADGAEGEVWVQGPTMMIGYFDDPRATAAAVTADGWLRTGDLGRQEGGLLHITGRLKELIIRGGENVAPQAVENALRDAPGIADLVAVPRPSAFWGEEICLVLLAAKGGTVDIAALRALAEARLPRFSRPDGYVLRDVLPLLPSGKVDRAAIRRAVASGEWQEGAGS